MAFSNHREALARTVLAHVLGALALGCGSSHQANTGQDAAPDLLLDASLEPVVDSPVEARNMFEGGATDVVTDAAPETGDTAAAQGPWRDLTATPLPAQWPSARWGNAVAFDSVRKKLVMFAGASNGMLDDLWEWDVVNGGWTDRTISPRPGAWPPSRFGHAMAFDETRSKIVVFGTPNGSSMFEDAWEWDPATGKWTVGAPAVRPTRRSGTTMVSDGVGGLWVFGGAGTSATGSLNELWEWRGATQTWVNRTPTSLPAEWPSVRSGHVAGFDAVRKRMLIFGGDGPASTQLDDVWELDLATTTWTSRTPSARPAPWPVQRADMAAAYFPSIGSFVVFGGLVSIPGMGISDQLWVFDVANGTWSLRAKGPLDVWPARIALNAMASVADGGALMFGGSTFGGDDNKLWRLSLPSP